MPYKWYEKQVDGSLLPLFLEGEFQTPEFEINPLQVSTVGDPVPPPTPLPPVVDSIQSTLTSRTSATIVWTAPNNTGRPPISDYRIYRSDNGGDEVFIGNTDSPTDFNFVDSPLPTGTPEVTFAYRVRAVNSDGVGSPSSAKVLQWTNTVLSPPAPATGLARGTLTSNSVVLTWDFPADATVDKQGIYNGNTLLVDNIDKAAKAYTWTPLVPGTTYSAINIRRHNASATNGGWSGQSNTVQFTVPQPGGTSQFFGHQPGKPYIGYSTDVNYAQTVAEVGQGVDVYRFFTPTDNAKFNICYTRVPQMIPWVSCKPNIIGLTGTDQQNWAAIAAGNADAEIRSLFDELLARNQAANRGPIVFTFNHEPIGPDRGTNAGNLFTSAFSRIVDIAKARPTWNDKIIFGPNYEEYVFRQGASPDWNAWMNSAFMNRMDFFSFNIYQFASTNALNAAPLRIGRIKSVLTQRGFGNIPLGVGECGGRQDLYGYGVDTSRQTSAQYGRQYIDYMKTDGQFWIVSWFNAVDVGDTRLTQPPYIPPDTETYMEVFREYLATGAHLSTIGIT